MGPLLNDARVLVTKDMKKDSVLNDFFTSVLTGKTGSQQSQAPETKAKVWSKKDLPLVKQEQVREHLDRPDIHKSMGIKGCTGIILFNIFINDLDDGAEST